GVDLGVLRRSQNRECPARVELVSKRRDGFVDPRRRGLCCEANKQSCHRRARPVAARALEFIETSGHREPVAIGGPCSQGRALNGPPEIFLSFLPPPQKPGPDRTQESASVTCQSHAQQSAS